MSREIPPSISFKIEGKIEEWVKIFEIKESDIRNLEFDIKTLFSGFSKDYPKKFICLNQAPEGNIKKFVQGNSKWIKIHKFDSLTIEEVF